MFSFKLDIVTTMCHHLKIALDEIQGFNLFNLLSKFYQMYAYDDIYPFICNIFLTQIFYYAIWEPFETVSFHF